MAKSSINWKNHFIELIVVIFGISIAFGIDKYAEGRKEAAEMEVALGAIMDDLRRDVDNFNNRQVPINEKRVNELNYILGQLRQENLDNDSLHVLMRSVFSSANTRITNATYESLKSSGKLEDIPNLEVRRRVVNHYESNYLQSDFISTNNIAYSNKLADYVSTRSSAFFTGDFSEPTLLKDPGFRSMLARWRNIVRFKVAEYKRLGKASGSLLEFMEKELN